MRPWREIVWLAVVLGAVVLAGIGQSDARAACGTTQRFPAERDVGPGRAPLVVGDSVMLGAAEEVAARGFEVDVRGCRPVDEGLRVLRKRRRAGRLPRLVAIALGSNSSFTREDVRVALRILGPRRRLGLVTPREPRGQAADDAPALRAAVKRWPKRTALVDWARYSKRRPRLTYSDGIHLTPAGQRAMARLLGDLLEPATAPETPPPPSDDGGTDGGGAQAP